MGDLDKRLKRLEADAGPEPIPPEIWFCADGWCHRGGDERITTAELAGLPNTSVYERVVFTTYDELEDVRDILKRLVRLEGGAGLMQSNSSNGLASLLQTAVVAVWCGHLQPHESLAEAHSRALKYDSVRSYRLALVADQSEWNRRHDALWQRLLEEQGVNASSPADEQITALANLLQPVPERIQQELRKRAEALSHESVS